MWERWTKDILPKSYEKQLVQERFKWSLEEFVSKWWKTGTSKVYELTRKSPNEKNVKELMKILNLDNEETAKKYFNQKCCECNKNLNPTDIAMNLKLFGRNIDMNKAKCKKCICKELGIKGKEYATKVREFREGGCNLF